MRLYHLAAASLLCVPLGAQNVTALFMGRFDMVSLDAANERAGGSLSQISGFDISYVTPGTGAVARSWAPTTAHASLMGDPLNSGDYTWFASIPDNWDLSSPFIKHADRALANPPVYFTVRDDRVALPFAAFDQFGSQVVTISAGDYFRWSHNGNVELFITQALLQKADGVDPSGGSESHGASALVQDAQGNLYYSPEEGGTWVIGNDPFNPTWCSRAGIIMIDAQDITYDANGNVQDVVADSAHVIFGGVNQGGPNGQPSIVDMAVNAGAMDYSGNPITSYYNTFGLALDPAGGTLMSSIPRVVSGYPVHDVVPHFVFLSDSGTHAATLFSTRDNPNTFSAGSIAMLNGVKCGSDISGVPASGAWWGVQQNTAAFSPTLLGIAFMEPISIEPFAADAPNHGIVTSSDPMLEIDFYPGPGLPTVMILSAGPAAPGQFQFSADVSNLLGPYSYTHMYPVTPPATISVPLGVSNAAGYLSFSVTNPWLPGLVGATLMVQGARTPGGYIELSTPVTVQFK